MSTGKDSWVDWSKALDESIESHKCREKSIYDGVLGPLPEWVPEAIVKSFNVARDKLLDKWEFDPKDAVRWVSEYIEPLDPKKIPEYPVVGPNGKNIDLTHFDETLATLAGIKTAVDLGADEGIKLLAGPNAQHGFRLKEGASGPRTTRLQELVNSAFSSLYNENSENPKAIDVLYALQDFDNPANCVVERIYSNDDIDYWDHKGRKKSVTWGTFKNMVGKAKKSQS